MEGHELWLAECAKIGYEPQARRYAEGTRTSQDAADQLGCDVAHIAKSIVFAGQEGAVVVITSGSNRVERKRKLKRVLGYKPGMATPEYVLESTGYQIGGVPPFGPPVPPVVPPVPPFVPPVPPAPPFVLRSFTSTGALYRM